MPRLYYDENTHLLRADELADETTDEYLNDNVVDVVGRIQDADGQDLTGEIWPLTMTYVAGSNGRYEVTVSHQVEVAAGDIIYVVVVATDSEGHQGHWKQKRLVADRS